MRVGILLVRCYDDRGYAFLVVRREGGDDGAPGDATPFLHLQIWREFGQCDSNRHGYAGGMSFEVLLAERNRCFTMQSCVCATHAQRMEEEIRTENPADSPPAPGPCSSCSAAETI